MNHQPSLFEGDRMSWEDALDLTLRSLQAYGERYRHWAIAFSGGKDSTATAAVVMHLLMAGRLRWPESLTILYADTRMELTPLHASAMKLLNQFESKGARVRVVLPPIDERFFVYMLGRGVPPPSNTFRWCTAQIKIEPMLAALAELREQAGEKLLMLTGVRMGESAARDARISVSCSKDGAECGQGWFQVATPEAVADTLAPLLHWRVCFVWDWLMGFGPADGFSTSLVAESYGGDEAQEVNARTGCVGCNLASRDVALETIMANPKWEHLQPLMELRPLYAWLKLPMNRLRKDGNERKKDGTLVANPNRMGPLTFDARLAALERLKDIQRRAGVDLVNAEEEARIRTLIDSKQWPDGWDGTEQRADVPFDEVQKDGSVQPVMMDLLKEAGVARREDLA